VLAARFSPAGVFVVAEQGPITLWNWRESRALHTYRFAHHGKRAVVSADGRYVAVGGAVLEVATDHELGEPKPLATESTLAFSASGKRVVSAGFHEPWMIVRDLPSGAVRQWQAPDKVSNAALSPSAEIVAASVKGDRIHFWHLSSGEELGSWQAHAEVRSICFTPTSGSLVVVDSQGLSLVDIARMQQTWRANLEGAPLVSACDGDLVAAGTSEGELWLWDVARQVLRARLRLSSSAVAALDISSMRRRIAAADRQGEAGIWGWR
jgi:WD40 repeat protein